MIIKKTIQQENIVKLLLKLEGADSELKKNIEAEISRRNLTEQEMQKAQREYSSFRKYVKKEERKKLPWYLKLSCIVAPFSASNINGSEELPERELERLCSTHNTKQKKEILKYSIIGIIIYASLAIIGMSLTIIEKLMN